MSTTAIKVLTAMVLFGCFHFAQSDWQSFHVTWGMDRNNSKVFAKMPETEDEARREGFFKLPGKCSGGKFLGSRYMKGLDPSAVLIFDVNGYIAGIQNGIPRKYVDKVNSTLSFERSPAYQMDKIFREEVYFLTAYFVNPNIICNGGRTKEQYEKQRAGTELHFQNGSDPITDSEEVPFVEAYMAGSPWTKGKYFKTMGVHYWYESDENLVCANFFPFSPIYNEGAIATFAFASFGDYRFSKRFEHPPSEALSMFFDDPIPRCLYEEFEISGGFSCMHVFFSTDPWNC